MTTERTLDQESLQLQGVCGGGGGVKKKESWKTILIYAYQSLGVIYGDLCVSPIYVYKSTFADDIIHSDTNEEIFGVLSFVFWTLTLIPLLKYVHIVLRADDNGEGGTLSLYSLLCRQCQDKLSLMPNYQVTDEEISGYKEGQISLPDTNKVSKLKFALGKNKVLQNMLLVLALIGAGMVIGDGVLIPAISVFSAISGELAIKSIELPIACIVLVCLFSLQHYGTHRIGFLFAPIIITWLLCISAIGMYNIYTWNPQVYKALSPYYMYAFFKKTRKKGWMSLGGILLCITGSEAMFADLGHFPHLSIKIAFTTVVYPSLILAYMGQAAYLSKNHIFEKGSQIGFYVSVPDAIRGPILPIAVLAAVVGSQAVISGTFSIIKQCSALGCFPKVKIIHTSSKIHGQIYIPEINWILMLLCLAVTIGFRDTKSMGNASGLAVITGMLVTTCLMSLVIVICWHQSFLLSLCFILFFGAIEGLYLSASLIKFREGAWVPIALSFVFINIMYIWRYGSLKKYEFDVQNKISIDWLLSLGSSLGIVRVRGIGVVHTELVSGIPSIFSHFVTNLPAFHQVLVFVCTKSVPIPHVMPEERFLVGRVGPKEYRIYRCIVRYGYRDIQKDDVEFERDLVCSIAEFIRSERQEPDGKAKTENMTVVGICSTNNQGIQMHEEDDEPTDMKGIPEVRDMQSPAPACPRKRVRFVLPESTQIDMRARKELQELMDARELGMTYILGHSYVKAQQGSSLLKRLVINFGYDFLRRNSRGPAYALSMPHISTVEVGMVYLV